MRLGCDKKWLACSNTEMATWLLMACALTTIAASQRNFYPQGRYGKRQESATPSFWSGSRYGRSGQPVHPDNHDSGKDVELAPRTDRFFLGSRYGKRAQPIHRTNSLKNFAASLDYIDHLEHPENDVDQQEGFPKNFKDIDGDLSENAIAFEDLKTGHVSTEDGGVTCHYTGITNLYRCFHRKDNASDDSPNRSSTTA